MFNLKTLKNDELLSNTKTIAEQDRKLQLKLLYHLREIDARSLYLKAGFSSLYDYVCKELKYSGSSAYRRIQAMKLLREVPDVESKIVDGSINLTTAGQIQSFLKTATEVLNSNIKANAGSAINSGPQIGFGFQDASSSQTGSLTSANQTMSLSKPETYSKKLTIEEKKGLINALENKSTREVERHLLSLQGENVVPKERVRQVTDNLVEIKIVITEELMQILEELRLKLSHVKPNMTYQELFRYLATKALKNPTPKEQALAGKISKIKGMERAKLQLEVQLNQEEEPPRVESTFSEEKPPQHSAEPALEVNMRYVSAELKRKIIQRDEGSCTYTDVKTGRRCGSRFQLEIDHIQPFALGGKTEEANLRLLCGNHNRFRAAETFGKRGGSG